MSEDVWTETPTAPAVAFPIVKPDNVTANNEAATAVPVKLMITDVLLVMAHVAAKPELLLLPGCTVGFEAPKKFNG
jgi:hypothetical protein